MTIKQAIRNAKVIRVKTSNGSSVKITKKEARRYIEFCDSMGYDYIPEITAIYANKVLVVLS